MQDRNIIRKFAPNCSYMFIYVRINININYRT